MDSFTRQYLETALWSCTDESREDGGDPMDRNYGIEDIAPATIAWAIADCDRFRETAGELLDERDDSDGAHDFWLTRCHHGAGFWDGDWPVNGDTLTALTHADFDDAHLMVGDDGVIYHYG